MKLDGGVWREAMFLETAEKGGRKDSMTAPETFWKASGREKYGDLKLGKNPRGRGSGFAAINISGDYLVQGLRTQERRASCRACDGVDISKRGSHLKCAVLICLRRWPALDAICWWDEVLGQGAGVREDLWNILLAWFVFQ